MSKKVRLTFMVDPAELGKRAYIKNPVRIKIIDPEAIFLTGILGESGRRLVKAGCIFYFEKKLADKLIQKGIAKIYKGKFTLPCNFCPMVSFLGIENEYQQTEEKGKYGVV